MTLTILWNRERLSLPILDYNQPLSTVKRSLSDYTQIPVQNLKLIYKGAVLNDDNAALYQYYLRPGSTITLLAAQPLQQPAPDMPSALESAMLERIKAEVADVRTNLAPELSQLKTKSDHLRVGELLLQSLLRLDALAPERDWSHARAQRKSAVKEVQALLDSLDEIKPN